MLREDRLPRSPPNALIRCCPLCLGAHPGTPSFSRPLVWLAGSRDPAVRAGPFGTGCSRRRGGRTAALLDPPWWLGLRGRAMNGFRCRRCGCCIRCYSRLVRPGSRAKKRPTTLAVPTISLKRSRPTPEKPLFALFKSGRADRASTGEEAAAAGPHSFATVRSPTQHNPLRSPPMTMES